MLKSNPVTTTSRSDVVFEVRPAKVRSGLPLYFPFNQLEHQTGFQSQFGVLKQQAVINQITGDTSGARYAVYCDTILVDFDSCPESALDFRRGLEKDSIAFVEAFSGGRSVHFHIACYPIFGVSVPASVKQWVASRTSKADLSVYHTNGMFRLFGTRHEKTGKIKEPTARVRGHAAVVRVIDAPVAFDELEGNVSEIEGALGFVLSLLNGQPPVGNRYQTLWSCAMGLKNALGDKSTTMTVIEGLINAINGTWQNQKEPGEISRLLREISNR